MRQFLQCVKQALSEFLSDGCMSSGAALAYYSIFALPPLVVMVFLLMSYAGVPQQRINRAIREKLGVPTSAEQLQQLTSMDKNRKRTSDDSGGGKGTTDTGNGEEKGQKSSLGAIAQERAPQPLSQIGIAGQAIGIELRQGKTTFDHG